MYRKQGQSDEYERLVKKADYRDLPPPEIPNRAKKSIIIAFLLMIVGFFSFYLFVMTFQGGNFFSNIKGRWAYFIIFISATPSGFYTIFIAYQVYHRNPNYNWPMLFF